MTLDEVRNISHSVAGCEPAENGAVLRTGKQTAAAEAPTFNTTDMGNSERPVHRHGDDLRYVCMPEDSGHPGCARQAGGRHPRNP